MLELTEKRQYVHEGEVFFLESLSASVVRVTHREQTGHFGIGMDWDDPTRPYRTTSAEGLVHTDGIRSSSFQCSTPDEALRSLCGMMLDAQRRADASRVDPEERRAAALQTLAEFMADLPEAVSRLPNKEVARLGKAIYERDICHLVEPDHDGEVVAIDVDSGKWALGEDVKVAVDNLREMQPEAINILCERAGYRALYSFGAGSLRKVR